MAIINLFRLKIMRNYLKQNLICLLALVGLMRCGDVATVDLELIQVGKYDNLKTNTYHTLVAGQYNRPESKQLDIDHDGIKDFEIISLIWGSPGIGQHPGAAIKCLHPLALVNVNRFYDTTFFSMKMDTFYAQKVFINIQEVYSCGRTGPDDSILSIGQRNLLKVLKNKDIITTSDPWFSGDVYLCKDSYVVPAQRIFQSADTEIFRYRTFQESCYNFPEDKIAYIGIMLKKAGEKKLGWLKLSIHDLHEVTLMETAVQP